MEIILFLIFLVILFFYLLDHRYTYWKRKNVPYIEPEYFYGNARGCGTTMFSGLFYREMYNKLKKFKPIAGFYLYSQPAIMVTDLDLIKTIFVKDFNSFHERGGYYNEKDDPTSANMAVLEGHKWKILRNKVTPVFTSEKIKKMFSIIGNVADRMIDRIAFESKEVGSIDVKTLFTRYTTDVIGEIAFGISCNSLNDYSAPFYKFGTEAFTNLSFLKRTFTMYYPNLSRKLGITVNRPEIVAFYKDVVEQTIKYREENNIERNDVFSLLIKLMKNSQLTFNEVLTQSIMFFLGGYETTSKVMMFTTYLLSQHKEIREKLRKNIAEALAIHNGEFTYEAVNEMHYLEQCINESMRMYPVGQASRRIATKDYQVPNTKVVIEKGTPVFVSFYGINLDPEIYPNPEKFDPDRFSPEEVEKRHSSSFTVFGLGPRMCLASRFAMVELKVTMAKILMNYDFELDHSKTPSTLTYEVRRVILTPKEDIFINFKRFNIPHIKPKFFYGNVKEFRETFSHVEFLQDIYNKLKISGPVVGAYIYFSSTTIFTDTEIIKTILLKNFENLLYRGIYYNEKHDPASADLVNLEDEKWKNLRYKITPTFSSSKLKLMLPIIESVTDKFMSAIEKESSGNESLTGFETTATTLTYCIFEVSNSIEIQKLARETVREVLEKFNGQYSYQALNEMKYLEWCLKETMRKYPPFTFLRRMVRKDFHVPGLQTLTPVYSVHHDPDIYPKPEIEAKRHEFSYLAFGHGPQICIGERFAMLEMKLAMAKILMNYNFELDTIKTAIPLKFDKKKIILTTADEIFVKVKSL
ncbi:hypothetical protein PVAND_004590 [Polypedilum vanderplanki]|uniref:Cytochrome P450 n=1 Tax=Polypedilum vanderplanki TaxID=319348 RepID=A0A9J6BXL1_POLVA|nr:hypothetical protein PVAND_004590 [Polypedilum vanderplanki]